MKKHFIPFELAVKLKEISFDEPCFGAYSEDKNNELIYDDENNNYHFRNCSMNDEVNGFLSAPLWQQATKFLYFCSNGEINIEINGKDNYEELCKKLDKAIEDFRNL